MRGANVITIKIYIITTIHSKAFRNNPISRSKIEFKYYVNML